MNFTQEMEVFYMLFERSLSISSRTSVKQYTEYFHIGCKIKKDLPVNCNKSNSRIVPLSRLERRIIVAYHALDVLEHRRRALHDSGGAGVNHVALAFRGAVLALKVVEAVSIATQTML